MNTREQRGIIIAATVKIAKRDGQWVVPSQSACDKRYVVNPEQGTCTCPDHAETGFVCKHIHAVMFTIKREQAADGTVTETRTLTFTEKKVYKQNWPSYNAAQASEKHRFQELLHDLCRGITQPPRKPGKGRPKTLLADMVFATTFKVYSTVSSRRFSCDLADAHAKGYTTNPIHYNSVCAYLENEELTPILKSLIARSSVPLHAVETDFAVDSSGFSVSRFVRWFDEKYGCERSGRDWVKVHLCCGVKTNIVTAATILDRDAADSPQFKPLVNETAETFRIREVSGDKAYLSLDAMETVAAHGGTAFIAFKENSTGAKGGLFEKMFHYFKFNSEEYMAHYHKRSNVESTFSSIKRKFGDNVRSRTDTAMRNEVFCKILAHNLCVVHESHVDLGIEPIFWPQTSNQAVTLPIRRV